MPFQRAFRPTRALGAAWQAALVAPGTLLGGGALLVLLDLVAAAGLWTLFGGRLRVEAGLGAPLAILSSCCATCLAAPVAVLGHAALLAGHARAVERVALRGEERPADLLEACDPRAPRALRGRLPAVLLTGVLAAGWRALLCAPPLLLALGGPRPGRLLVLVLALAAAVLSAPLVLAPYAVAFEGLDAGAALARARSLAAGHRVRLLGHEALLLAFAALGLGLCLIGVLLTGALAEVARSESYLRLVRRGPWWLDGGA